MIYMISGVGPKSELFFCSIRDQECLLWVVLPTNTGWEELPDDFDDGDEDIPQIMFTKKQADKIMKDLEAYPELLSAQCGTITEPRIHYLSHITVSADRGTIGLCLH